MASILPERGYGLRAAVGCSDRGHTAISQAKPGDFDWDAILGPRNGARWLHTGGIFAASRRRLRRLLSRRSTKRGRHGTVTSFDLNYRESLWKSIGGKAKAQAVNRALVSKLDVLFGNEEDSPPCWGSSSKG